MKRIAYTILAKISKALQVLGRGLRPFFTAVGRYGAKFFHVVMRRVIFVVLRLASLLKRYWHGYSAPFKDKVWIIATSPWTFRGAILAGIVLLLAPQTSVFARTSAPLAQESLLYRLVGPGEEYFVEEGVTQSGFLPADSGAWSAGAVRQEVLESAPDEQLIEPTDITSLARGGTAITKPNIIQGADLGEQRREVVSYLVQQGDVLGSIAQAYGVTISTILWENNLTYRSYIRPGDTLRILPLSGIRYTVKSGDTLSRIAKKYDANVGEIMDFNKLATASDITIGETLLLPGGSKPAAAAPRRSAPSTAARRIAAPLPSINVPAGQLYIWPTTVKRITQYYGWRHTGLDVAGPVGTPLVASRAGTVTRSKCGWSGGYGCHVILNHGDGVQTIYAHASALYVDVGEKVEQGQTIAAMGSTGRSTGSHIHYEVRVNGTRQNPLKYVR